MKFNVDTIPIFDGIENAKIKTEASKEGFLGTELNNVREGLMSPAEVFLDKSNSYLIEKGSPLTDTINATETEVKITANKNINELKRNIIKKLEEKALLKMKERKKAKPTKTIERRDGFVNFSNFYDETYDFD